MLPVINTFKTVQHLTEVTVVADASMISEANQIELRQTLIAIHAEHAHQLN